MPSRRGSPGTFDVLFAHNNFPAQFRDLASQLQAKGFRCAAIGSSSAPGLPGVSIARWTHTRGTTPGILPLAIRAEADLIRGEAAVAAAERLRDHGFRPKLIIGHPGWGETLFLKEVFPDARSIIFHELFYSGQGSDIDFDPEFGPVSQSDVLRAIAKNSTMALALSQADAIVTPTNFQLHTLPKIFARAARVIHEGVDTADIRPSEEGGAIRISDEILLPPGTPLITHINRSLEPMRGLHILLRALTKALSAAPNAHAVIIGSEQRGYGAGPPSGNSWKQYLLEQLSGQLDLSRVHFLGRVSHSDMIRLLQRSTAHVYYTYPFVLSWSLCEAMSAGCYVIASDTAPVRDAIEDGVNGRLLDFFDVDGLAEALVEACRNPDAARALRSAARQTAIDKFDQKVGREKWFRLIQDVISG